MRTELKVSGMSCNHCVSAVKSALLDVPGVAAAEVSLEPGRAIVDHDAGVSIDRLIEAIVEEGYEATPHASL